MIRLSAAPEEAKVVMLKSLKNLKHLFILPAIHSLSEPLIVTRGVGGESLPAVLGQ